MMYSNLTRALDTMLEELGSEPDPKFKDIGMEEIENKIKVAEEDLAKEYQKIEQIKLKSLQEAMNEEVVYI